MPFAIALAQVAKRPGRRANSSRSGAASGICNSLDPQGARELRTLPAGLWSRRASSMPAASTSRRPRARMALATLSQLEVLKARRSLPLLPMFACPPLGCWWAGYRRLAA